MSRILQLHSFLLDLGALREPIIRPEDERQVADLEAAGAFTDLDRWFDFTEAPAITTADWLREPVSVREFLTDPYYAGPAAGALFPILADAFVEVFEQNIHEVILAGSIGWGKTYFMAWGMFRQLYELSCLVDPQPFLGIAPGTPIVMVNLSVTGTQAKNACFNYVRTLVDGSPYFQEHFPRNPKLDSALHFSHNVIYQPGSSSEFSAIGTNLIAGAVDEASFLVSAKKMAHEKLQAQDVDHARVLYRALARRIESRFKFSRGWKGRLFLASSRVYEGDFIDQQVIAKRDRPGVRILDFSHWQVRGFGPDRETRDPKTGDVIYSGRTFEVAIGGTGDTSRILGPGDVTTGDTEVLRVPVEYRDSFETDLEGSIRDIAGRSTLAINPWVPNRRAILQQAVREFDGHPLIHPFPDDGVRGLIVQPGLEASLNLGALSTEYVTLEGRGSQRKRIATLRPRRSPDQPRYVHVDLAATNDAAGLAMAYVAGFRKARIRPDRSIEVETREVPIIVFELLVSLTAPIGGEIEFSNIREVIYRLRDEGGFFIASVTFDQWQSRDSRQILAAKGFTVDEVSVDRDVGPYTVLRNGITEGWIQYYEHATVLRELRKLQRVTVGKRIKVDHPEFDPENPRGGKGSKDVTDAMAAVVATIMERNEGQVGAVAPIEGGLSQLPAMPTSATKWENPENAWLVSDYIRQDAARRMKVDDEQTERLRRPRRPV